MNKLAVFYHTCINVNRDHGINIIAAQMQALRSCGLLPHVDQFICGVNGDETDELVVASMLPEPGTTFINHPGTWASGEVPTINFIHDWLIAHPSHYVMYHHMKGLSCPPGSHYHSLREHWRWCMQTHVVERWRECVDVLDQGYEVCGAHFVTPSQYPGNGHVPFMAGNFWWAKASFLSTLPRLDPTGHLEGGRYEAEAWIGRGTRWPKGKDMKEVSHWVCGH